MTDVATIGDTLFGSGVDGAGNALGNYIELHLTQALAAGNQVLTAALSEIVTIGDGPNAVHLA